ncbi:conserved hypothetical protein [Streptomyces sviceus ATCC 29083]|uniref:Uncharacterized protein n=1 Tax=Streptomyces sviceus (strain ATCC 29083 / DSM 924 / JCM 4929 / NBRC 13980 / NCIMB 11184 / NRRL 5439 / UC 5370) TaxID=463191 RepID=B5I1M1_STRX2|nr:conserved hypothetical protein [Streptomyces sviceus ATCC 29083]
MGRPGSAGRTLRYTGPCARFKTARDQPRRRIGQGRRERPRRAEGIRSDGEEDVPPAVGVGQTVAVMTRTLLRADRNRPGVIKSPKVTTSWKPMHEIPSVTPEYSVDGPSGLPSGSAAGPRPGKVEPPQPGPVTTPPGIVPGMRTRGGGDWSDATVNGLRLPSPRRPSPRWPNSE